MRRLAIGWGGAIAAALALSACGAGATGSFTDLLSSVGTSSNTQLHVTATFGGPGAAGSTVAREVLRAVSLDVRVSSVHGSTLRASLKASSVELVLNVGGAPAIDVRAVGARVYVEADFAALAKLPGVSAASGELGAAALLSDKWFEFAPSTLTGILNAAHQHPAADLRDVARAEAVGAGLTSVVEHLHRTHVPGGYRVAGTLASLGSSLFGVLRAVDPRLPAPRHVSGTYSLVVTGSGGAASALALSVTAPNGVHGLATATVHVTVSHDGTVITAPSGATLITPQLLAQLGAGG